MKSLSRLLILLMLGIIVLPTLAQAQSVLRSVTFESGGVTGTNLQIQAGNTSTALPTNTSTALPTNTSTALPTNTSTATGVPSTTPFSVLPPLVRL